MKTGLKTKGIWTMTLAVLILYGAAAHAKDDLRLRTRLVGPRVGSNQLKGHADYRLREARSRRKFKVEIENGTAGDLLDILVAGEVVGTITVNEFGFGELELDDKRSSSSTFVAAGGSGSGSSGDSGSGSDDSGKGGSGSGDDGDDGDDSDDDDSNDDSGDDSSGDDSGGDSSDRSGSRSVKQPFPSNFPVLNGGELIQVGALSGTFQIDD